MDSSALLLIACEKHLQNCSKTSLSVANTLSHSHIIQSLDTIIPCQHFFNLKLQLHTFWDHFRNLHTEILIMKTRFTNELDLKENCITWEEDTVLVLLDAKDLILASHRLRCMTYWDYSNDLLLSLSLNKKEHGHLYKWSPAAEGIQRTKSFNWQKTGNRAGCHDHFTTCGCCQQHLDEQDSQLCSSLVTLQQLSGKQRTKGPDAENDVDWSWKSCMQGWRNVAIGWWGAAAAARCMMTLLPDKTLILDDSAKKPWITLNDVLEWSMPPLLKYFYNVHAW